MVPYFVFFFLIASAVATYVPAVNQWSATVKAISAVGFQAALYLIGSGLSKKAMREVGWRALVLAPDRTTAKLWGKLRAVSQSQGYLLSPTDAWVAATAVQYGLELATDDKDFGRVTFPGLRVLCRTP